jgi:hypothetical protein
MIKSEQIVFRRYSVVVWYNPCVTDLNPLLRYEVLIEFHFYSEECEMFSSSLCLNEPQYLLSFPPVVNKCLVCLSRWHFTAFPLDHKSCTFHCLSNEVSEPLSFKHYKEETLRLYVYELRGCRILFQKFRPHRSFVVQHIIFPSVNNRMLLDNTVT